MIENEMKAAPPSLLASISCWAMTIVAAFLRARGRDGCERGTFAGALVLLPPVQTEEREPEEQQREQPVEDDRLADRAVVVLQDRPVRRLQRVAHGTVRTVDESARRVLAREAELHGRVPGPVPEEVLGLVDVLIRLRS